MTSPPSQHPESAPSVPPSPTWRLTRGAQLTWQHWDDESVVFDSQTGDTHLVDLVAREGILCLDEPLDLDALTQRLAARLDVVPDDRLRRYAQQLVARFVSLGLLETANR